MNNSFKSITTLFIVFLYQVAVAGPITLTDRSGASYTGIITTCSIPSDSLSIRTDTGTIRVALSDIDTASKELAIHWLADKAFLSRSKLKVELNELPLTSSTSNVVGTVKSSLSSASQKPRTIGEKISTYLSYAIQLDNRSEYPQNDIELSYRIFFTDEIRPELIGHFQLVGTEAHDQIAPLSQWSGKTTPFNSYTWYRSAYHITWNNRPRNRSCDILGTEVTLSKRSVTGERIIRKEKFGDVPSSHKMDEFQKIYNWPYRPLHAKESIPSEDPSSRKKKRKY